LTAVRRMPATSAIRTVPAEVLAAQDVGERGAPAALERGFQRLERAADVDARGWLVGVQERAQEPVSELGVEDGDADPVGGQDVARESPKRNAPVRWPSWW